MLDYLGVFVVFLAALVAVKGGTWDNNKKGLRKITLTGLASIIIACLGFLISIGVTNSSKKEADINRERLKQTLENTENAKKKSKGLEIKLSDALKKADELDKKLSVTMENARVASEKARKLETQIEVYKALMVGIYAESQRQPQHVMGQFVSLKPFDIWPAPNRIYGGSIVKLYGFEGPAMVVYGPDSYRTREYFNRLRYPQRHRSTIRYELDRIIEELKDESRGRMRFQEVLPNREGHSEVSIIGRPGEGIHWAIINLSSEENYDKVFVEYTPRIRSETWSWIEERLAQLQELPSSGKVRVKGDILNMRQKPNIESTVVGKLERDTILEILEKKGWWLKVQSGESSIGWVSGRYVEIINE